MKHEPTHFEGVTMGKSTSWIKCQQIIKKCDDDVVVVDEVDEVDVYFFFKCKQKNIHVSYVFKTTIKEVLAVSKCGQSIKKKFLSSCENPKVKKLIHSTP